MIRVMDTNEDILNLERLRLKSTRSSRLIHTPTQTLYGQKLVDGEFLGLGLEKEEQLLAGCILSGASDELYIEWIFTDPEQRKKGYASKLLKYLENNLDIFNEYYNRDFQGIKLESYIGVEGFYIKNGYTRNKNDFMVKKLNKSKSK